MKGINKIRADEIFLPDGFGNFQALTANTLGNQISDGDGWDDDINAVASLLGDDLNTVSSLDLLLVDAGFVTGALDSAVLLPLAQDHADLIGAGDPLLADLGQTISGAPGQSPPPAPGGNPPPNPPPDGGPGGSPPGGTGTGGPSDSSGGVTSITCILFDHANAPPTTSCTIQGDKIGGGIHPTLEP